jgi:hypothetical protein
VIGAEERAFAERMWNPPTHPRWWRHIMSAQGNESRHLQRARRDRRREADVSFSVRENPLLDSPSRYYEWQNTPGGKQPYYVNDAVSPPRMILEWRCA